MKLTEDVEWLFPADLLLDSDAEDDKYHHGGEGENHQPQESDGHPGLAQDHGWVLVLPGRIAWCLRHPYLGHWSIYLGNWILLLVLCVIISQDESSSTHVYHRVALLHPVSEAPGSQLRTVSPVILVWVAGPSLFLSWSESKQNQARARVTHHWVNVSGSGDLLSDCHQLFHRGGG